MSRTKTILMSVLLVLPVLLFLLQQYFYHARFLSPTGFTVNENVLYMSYAHQYLDNNHSFFYSNPFDGNPESPKIYFQPINLVFAAGMKAGMDPGLLFSLFGLLMAVACIYTGFRLIQFLLPEKKYLTIIVLLFTWGGGLTAIAGLIGSNVLPGHQYSSFLDGIFLADPANGWWGLNWGRNLFIPLEAFYHFLFLTNIYFVLCQKWKSSLVITLLLSISHPFTGLEFLAILNGWIFIEKIFFHNTKIPAWFWLSLVLIFLFHVWYYLVFLNSFPEHKLIFTQYSAGWTYSILIAAAAYCLVGGLAFITAYLNRPVKKFFSVASNRLFLCWAVIAFLLSKHEWFMSPLQPIHFTRGYVWSGLFFLSIPGLSRLYSYLKEIKAGKIIILTGIVIFLSDNLLWTINLLRKKENVEWEGHITKDTRYVFQFLNSFTNPNDLIIGNAPLISYMSNVYTSANSWISHPFNTPHIKAREEAQKLFFEKGIKPSAWQNRRIIIVIDKKNPVTTIPIKGTEKIFENKSYEIFTLL